MSEAKAEVSPEIMAKIRAAEDFHKAKFCPLTQRPCGDVDCQLWVGLEGAAATPLPPVGRALCAGGSERHTRKNTL